MPALVKVTTLPSVMLLQHLSGQSYLQKSLLPLLWLDLFVAFGAVADRR
jgi:hypothetical protein